MAKNKALSLRMQWLGDRLRRARLRAGLTLEESGEYLQMRYTTLSRFENGIYRPRPSYVKDLINFYGVSDERERAALLQLNEDAWRKDWWIGDSTGLEIEFIDYTWLEARAEHICVYEPMLIHGLLQTREYASALTQAGMPDAPAETTERMVELRMNRQQILSKDNPAKISLVTEETPLFRRIGSPGTHRAQLLHLLEQSERDNVEIRVLPKDSGWHQGLDGPFAFIVMPDPYPDVTYVENLVGRTFLEDEPKVDRYRRAYDDICRVSLTPADSARFITNMLKDPQ